MLATVVYEFLRTMDHTIPPINQQFNLSDDLDKITSTATNHNSSLIQEEALSKPASHPSGFMYRLSSLLGMSDTTPGVEVLSSDSIEMQLLGSRPVYTSLRHIHNRMHDSQILLPIKTQLEEWFSEVIGPVKEYMHRLVMHVLKYKHIKAKDAKDRIIGHGMP